MPEMGGIECTKHIRKGLAKVLNPDITIVALTADAMKDAELKARDAGMDGYVPKPIRPEQLLMSIKKVLWPNISEKELNQPNVKIIK